MTFFEVAYGSEFEDVVLRQCPVMLRRLVVRIMRHVPDLDTRQNLLGRRTGSGDFNLGTMSGPRSGQFPRKRKPLSNS